LDVGDGRPQEVQVVAELTGSSGLMAVRGALRLREGDAVGRDRLNDLVDGRGRRDPRPPTEAFARMVHSSRALTGRGHEITNLREQTLAEADGNNPQPRIVAAQLASVHRVLFPGSVSRSAAMRVPACLICLRMGEISMLCSPVSDPTRSDVNSNSSSRSRQWVTAWML
jgi:hypothetical protein